VYTASPYPYSLFSEDLKIQRIQRVVFIPYLMMTILVLACLAIFAPIRALRAPPRLLMSSIDTTSYSSAAPTVLKADSISKSWVGKPQFQEISIALRKGQRSGLIGVNGAGKTTLLRCLSGLDEPDSGSIESERACNIVYVDQEPQWPEGMQAYEALFADVAVKGSQPSTESARAVRTYLASLAPEAETADDYIDMLSRATDLMEQADAWTYMDSGLSIAKRLNVDMLYRQVSTMSGGERKRIGLAAALLRQPDVLLLDEPTNHLDVDALEWLAEFLGSRSGGGEASGAIAADKSMSVLLVTHDRHFLEMVCNEIIELDRASVHTYPGNYAKYLELKDERLRAEDAEQDRAKTRLRKEREWMSRQPKARQAKSKARQQQFFALVDKATDKSKGSAGAGAGAVKLSTKEEADQQQRLGNVVIEVKNAKYVLHGEEVADEKGEKGDGSGSDSDADSEKRLLLDGFSYSFRQRDRIAIVGPNGVGKSTFLKLLTGNLPLLDGTIRIGETVRLGYYEQMGLQLSAADKKEPVLKFVQAAVEKGVSRNINTLDGSVANAGYDYAGGSSGAGKGPPQNANAGKIVISTSAPVGRRKALAGKEGAINLEVADDSYGGGGGSSSVAMSEREAMNLLTRFNFPSARWYDQVDKLSGGEKRRLQLLQCLATRPNVLLLDEPSNDLDLATLQVLEDYLVDTFAGMLVVVSHDNFLVNKVAEHLFVFEGDGIVRDFQGSYDDYLAVRRQDKEYAASVSVKIKAAAAGAKKKPIVAQQQQQQAAVTTNTAASSSSVQPITQTVAKEKSKLTYPEQKELMKLEKGIARLQTLIAAKEEDIVAEINAAQGYSILAAWQEEVDGWKRQLEDDEERWLVLAEKL
jgi:ATPase subunit of ABC transporter with duplicated ATPase domains